MKVPSATGGPGPGTGGGRMDSPRDARTGRVGRGEPATARVP
jgi:hypothetical protein